MHLVQVRTPLQTISLTEEEMVIVNIDLLLSKWIWFDLVDVVYKGHVWNINKSGFVF